jgi:rare lipoprotein A (peptidoglycan hydrolase)
VSACFMGASALGPNKAFAQTTTADSGKLGVGAATVEPLATPILVVDRISAFNAMAVQAAPASAPAFKIVTTSAQAAHDAERRAASVRSRRYSSAAIGTRNKKWSSARVSWYGPGFYGHTMAGGGPLKRNSMIVAHKKLPFGTKIEFSYKGRICTAIVKDRGPYVSGRTFDLGPGTARALKFSGVGTVKYRIISKPKAKKHRHRH